MRKSTLSGIIGFLLAGALTAGVCCAGYASRNADGKWFKNSNISTWHWSDKSTVDNEGNGDNQDNEFTDGDLIHVTEDNGIKLRSVRIAPEDYDEYGIDTQAETAYNITASVNADAVDKSVIGSIAWKNSSSEWATGKNISDYVGLRQLTKYGLEFTLTYKQPFGEPIIFKVASAVDSSINATLQVDCLKKIKWFKAVVNPSLSETAAGRYYIGDTVNTIAVEPTYGVGTIEGVISGYKAELTTNSYFTKNLKAALDAGNGTTAYSPVDVIEVTGKDFKIPYVYLGSNWGNGLVHGSGNDNGATIVAHNFIAKYGCGDACGTMAATAGVTSTKFYITYSYGNDYSVELTYTDDKSHGFRNDNISVISSITEINLDKNGIVMLPIS